MPERTCSVDGCGEAHQAKGLCGRHYYRWRRHGDPHGGGPSPMRGSAEERFWARVQTTDACWLWLGPTDAKGYGRFHPANGVTVLVHRFAYELLVGPIPSGMELDHVRDRGCTNRHCVNPAHLEPVTHAENVRRSEAGRHNAIKTHCPHGHPYDEKNTYSHNGGRYCRTCNAERLKGEINE